MPTLTLNNDLVSSPKQFCVSVITSRQLNVRIIAQELSNRMTLEGLCQKALKILTVNRIDHIVIQRIDFSRFKYDSVFSVLTKSGIKLSFEPKFNESVGPLLPFTVQKRIKVQ